MDVESAVVHVGDCRDILAMLPDSSVDSIVTDPPYELGFMGKAWDSTGIAYDQHVWAECLRVLKPGGHLLAFSGSRTYHRMACAIEDAGFEIRDQIMWVYGSGFPKSLDVSKAIDKQRIEDFQPAAEVARWLVGHLETRGLTRRDVSDHFGASNMVQQWTTYWTDGAVKPRVPRWEQWKELRLWLDLPDDMDAEVWRLNQRKGTPGVAWESRGITGQHGQPTAQQVWMQNYSDHVALPPKERRDLPSTDDAARWQGWGTALKPAHEPIVLARKPLVGTVAANVLQHGTGALNIDDCRIAMSPDDYSKLSAGVEAIRARGGTMQNSWKNSSDLSGANPANAAGRWPANFIHDGSDEIIGLFPQQKSSFSTRPNACAGYEGGLGAEPGKVFGFGDSGSAARFFYCAKASKADRNEGLDGFEKQQQDSSRKDGNPGGDNPRNRGLNRRANHHPTVKPTDLMRYLCRLITPPNGVVLDPFTGSGSTGKAAMLEGFLFIGIEQNPEYAAIAEARIAHAKQQTEREVGLW